MECYPKGVNKGVRFTPFSVHCGKRVSYVFLHSTVLTATPRKRWTKVSRWEGATDFCLWHMLLPFCYTGFRVNGPNAEALVRYGTIRFSLLCARIQVKCSHSKWSEWKLCTRYLIKGHSRILRAESCYDVTYGDKMASCQLSVFSEWKILLEFKFVVWFNWSWYLIAISTTAIFVCWMIISMNTVSISCMSLPMPSLPPQPSLSQRLEV